MTVTRQGQPLVLYEYQETGYLGIIGYQSRLVTRLTWHIVCYRLPDIRGVICELITQWIALQGEPV